MLSVDEAFKILKEHKITTHIESVRRWLRSGEIKGVKPQSRKEGWRIDENDLYDFIKDRTTFVAKEEIEEQVRTDMWWELVRKHIFEDYIELKKRKIKACIEHRGYSSTALKRVWEEVSQHTRGYATPRVPYLLDAFLYNNHRIKMNDNFEDTEEKILYALVDHVIASWKHSRNGKVS